VADSDAQHWPHRWRWVALGSYLILLIAGWAYYPAYDPKAATAWNLKPETFAWLAVILTFFLAIQTGLVCAIAHLRRRQEPPPVLLSALLGGAMMAFVFTLLVSVALANWWNRHNNPLDLAALLWIAVPLAVFFGSQAAFLSGAPQFRGPRLDHRRPAWLSLLAGTFLLGLLSVCLGLTFCSWLWLQGNNYEMGTGFPIVALVALLSTWIFWLVLFAWMWQRAGSIAYRRLYRALLGGSLLELFITIPVDMQVRKRTDCYCAHGVFFALPLVLALTLWCFGPGLVMLFLTRGYQRRRRPGFCHGCGLYLGDANTTRCPECGTPFYQSRAQD
jgi:hypothetical protein